VLAPERVSRDGRPLRRGRGQSHDLRADRLSRSLGLSDIGGNSQATQTDPFARWNGCTVETLPTAPAGSHVCTDYAGCPATDPVRWCSYDGGHTASPTDAGQSRSWMPEEVWAFVSRF
jgi:hypothetical protein